MVHLGIAYIDLGLGLGLGHVCWFGFQAFSHHKICSVRSPSHTVLLFLKKNTPTVLIAFTAALVDPVAQWYSTGQRVCHIAMPMP